MAVQADQELRRNESDRRELDFQSYVESEWDGPAIVTEIRVEGDQRAWGEVAFSDRTCEFEYGIDQRDYGRYDRADFEVRCK